MSSGLGYNNQKRSNLTSPGADGDSGPPCRDPGDLCASGPPPLAQVISRPIVSNIYNNHRTQKTARPGAISTMTIDHHNMLQMHMMRNMFFLNMKLGPKGVRIRPRNAPLLHTAQERTIVRVDAHTTATQHNLTALSLHTIIPAHMPTPMMRTLAITGTLDARCTRCTRARCTHALHKSASHTRDQHPRTSLHTSCCLDMHTSMSLDPQPTIRLTHPDLVSTHR